MAREELIEKELHRLMRKKEELKDEYDRFLCNILPSHTLLNLYRFPGIYTISIEKNWYKNETRVQLIIRCSENEHILIPFYVDEQENYFKQEVSFMCTLENYVIKDVVITEKNIAKEFDEDVKDDLNEKLLNSRVYIVSKDENSPYSVIEKITPSIEKETKERRIRIDTLYVDDTGRLINMSIGQEEPIGNYKKEYKVRGK